jgi:hypothetical protein
MFCDLAEGVIIISQYSQIWLLDKYEKKFLKIYFGYLLEPHIEY